VSPSRTIKSPRGRQISRTLHRHHGWSGRRRTSSQWIGAKGRDQLIFSQSIAHKKSPLESWA
jgi:hypothetical protein